MLAEFKSPVSSVFFKRFISSVYKRRKAFYQPVLYSFCDFCVLVIIIHFIYGASASSVKKKLATGKAFSYLNKTGGSVFMVFAIGLIVSVITPYFH